MKLGYFLAAALSAATVAGATAATALAHEGPGDVQIIIGGRDHGPGLMRSGMRFDLGQIDANKDGFVSRDEMRAEAERLFDARDRNDDSKLNSEDRGERGERRGDRREERTVIINRRDERGGPDRDEGGPPRPPRPPMMPMVMILAASGEADLNNDGSLSKEEFVAQQLRYFDASDVNRDGKVKLNLPPAPPEPPAPPAPPAPPRR